MFSGSRAVVTVLRPLTTWLREHNLEVRFWRPHPALHCYVHRRMRANQGAGNRLAPAYTEGGISMPEQNVTTNSRQEDQGLLVARRRITAARSRAEQPSDGGSTGRSDGND